MNQAANVASGNIINNNRDINSLASQLLAKDE